MKFEDVESEINSSKDFDFDEAGYAVFINNRDEIIHFHGLTNLKDEKQHKLLPGTVDRVNLRKGDWRLIRLTHGALIHDFGPLDTKSKDQYKTIHDHVVRLPAGLRNEYGVFNRKDNWSENKYLTRELFCITQDELGAFLMTFTKLFQSFNPISLYPKTTFSRQNNHTCDISQQWIPESFPYIAFAQSQYYWSHISLFGFFRFISWLCMDREKNISYGHLINNGVPKELLDRIIDAPAKVFWQPIIKRTDY